MYDEDQETLAAEYVLGTLSADERERAEALRSLDSGFEATVRQWERRLGELNVMVEAVEPPADVWDKIKTQIGPVEPVGEIDAPPEEGVTGRRGCYFPPSVFDPERSTTTEAPAHATAEPPTMPSPPVPEAGKVERSADVVYLAGRVRRWQRTALGIGALAALLALYIAVWQVVPDRIPAQLRPPGAGMLAQTEVSAPMPQDRLVAVLQQGPTAPAFLLTLDTQHRTLTVRRISAKPETGKSYELWLISSRFPAPRSLGVVGADEFTQRALPGNYDADTLRTANYAVSLEPANGSPNGAPTGPVLFTGKAVESIPAPAPAKPTTPHT